MTKEGKAIVLACVSVLSWATVATAFKIALRQLTVVEMLTIASATTTLIFALWLTFTHQWSALKGLSGGAWLRVGLLGLVNPVAYYLCLFSAYDFLPAQIAQPINYMWPILLVVMLAALGHKPIAPRKYVGLVVSLLGLAIISLFGSSLGGLQISAFGVVLALCSALLWASYWLLNDKLKDTLPSESAALFCGFLFGTIIMLLICAVSAANGSLSPISLSGVLAGVYIGCFEMGVPFLCFGMALRLTTNPALVNQLCYLAPFLSLALIASVLGEPIAATTYIGLTLIVAGVAWNAWK